LLDLLAINIKKAIPAPVPVTTTAAKMWISLRIK